MCRSFVYASFSFVFTEKKGNSVPKSSEPECDNHGTKGPSTATALPRSGIGSQKEWQKCCKFILRLGVTLSGQNCRHTHWPSSPPPTPDLLISPPRRSQVTPRAHAPGDAKDRPRSSGSGHPSIY